MAGEGIKAKETLSLGGAGLVLLFLLLVVGCASLSKRPSARSIHHVFIDQAWISQGVFHAEFEDHGRRFHYEGAIEANLVREGFGRVVPLHFSPLNHTNSTHRQSVQLRDEAQWAALRQSILTDLLPDDGEEGIKVRQGDRTWYLRRVRPGQEELTLYREPPVETRFPWSYTMEDFQDRTLACVERMEGGTSGPLAYRTGQEGSDGLHYAVIDPATRDGFYVEFMPPEAGQDEVSHLETGLSFFSLLHIIGHSHTIGLITHPISAPRELTYHIIEIPTKLIRETDLTLRQFPLLDALPIPPLNPGRIGMNVEDFEAWLDEETGTRRFPSDATLLINGEPFFSRLTEALAQARESILIRMYIFDNDDVAMQIADILREKSQTIEVRLILDNLGTRFASMVDADSAPPSRRRSMMKYLEKDSKVKVRHRPNFWLGGDHTKCILVDRRAAWIGGMNIGREYRYDWHDMMIELHGPLVGDLVRDFDKAWADAGWGGDLARFFARSKVPDDLVASSRPIRLLQTKRGNGQIYSSILEAIRRAQSRIWIENAYFSDDTILSRICEARKRGVDVRVILPLRGDSGIMDRSNATAANTMLKHGVRVFIHNRMTHVKAALFDGWVTTGSANYDHVSFKMNLELNLASSDQSLVHDLTENLFQKDMDNSVELTRPLPTNILDDLVEIFADVL